MSISDRDYFAAKAMQALIQARTTLDEEETTSFSWATACGLNAEIDLQKDKGGAYRWAELLAEEAYEVADAMLEHRS